jgi:hypothetical protein
VFGRVMKHKKMKNSVPSQNVGMSFSLKSYKKQKFQPSIKFCNPCRAKSLSKGRKRKFTKNQNLVLSK